MQMKYSYYLIDAFTRQIFQGAPIAVFPDATGLSKSQMQNIARELNQTEAVFMFEGEDSYISEIRIFTPQSELNFGGHPIIAASYALLNDKKISKGEARLKTSIGMIDIHVSENNKLKFSINAETKTDDFVPSAKELGEMLYLEESDIDLSKYRPMISGCGENFLIIPVKSCAQLDKARFSKEKWTTSFVATLAKQILLFCENKTDKSVDFNARLFGKGISHNEDPPIGTSVPAFGNYIFADAQDGIHAAILQRGGGERRISTIEVEIYKEQGIISKINVGGHGVMAGDGSIYLD
jgi:PhzF family phenazine biosynthesis protein